MNIPTDLSTRSASLALASRQADLAPASVLNRWPDLVAYAAAAWSVGYAALALWWWVGHPGLPPAFVDPPGAEDPVGWGFLESLGAAPVAMLAFTSALLALYLTRTSLGGPAGALKAAAACAVAATLLLGVPDARAVAVLAYSPFFVLGAPFGWPPVGIADVFPWPVVNQVVCLLGGILWGPTALIAVRRARGACPSCGRTSAPARWTSPAAARRWGAAAVCVAVTVPLLYATTRIAWAAGVPLGITETFLRQGQEIGMWTAGLLLASVAIAGAVLTIGLVRPWGEVFPRWFPVVRGQRVPPWVAIAPAALMSCLFLAAGLDAVGSFAQDGFPEEGWGTTAPSLLWPVWGIALGAATFAYHLRRRGRCGRCRHD